MSLTAQWNTDTPITYITILITILHIGIQILHMLHFHPPNIYTYIYVKVCKFILLIYYMHY
jgi:hypothetical protein